MLISRVAIKTTLIIAVFLTTPFFVFAQTKVFNIDPSYDLFARTEIEAELIRTTPNLYFYLEKSWWEGRSSQEQNEIRLSLFDLGEEFRTKIYPILTSTFGSEPKPGIDKDERITVLIHQMRSDAGGYFSSGNLYSRFQVPGSNEREMVYLNAQHITSPKIKSFLAHEFIHLITINQKDLLRKVTEEIWLNEARAEYAPTLLGYDDNYKGSNLETRVKAFLENSNVSLTEWLNKKEDYGAVNLFIQYLVDHYGKKILIDSLQSTKIGIPSLEEALQKNGFNKNFSQIFADWLITLLVNDCQLGEQYCYLNKNLKNLRITPTFYYLPKVETILSTVHGTTYWSPNWHKFIGGRESFSLEFEGQDSVEFEVPYLLCDFQNQCSIGFLNLDAQQKGKISLTNFNQKYSSLTITPFIKSKKEGFDGQEKIFTFSWRVSVGEKTQAETELKNQLLAKIAQLKTQIRQLQAQLATLREKRGTCTFLGNNLYYGMMNNPDVRCLQEFLKAQGPEIYPEGLVTGNFLSLTKQAVIRFQEKYAIEILAPLGLEKGTGYVGERTRAKINQLLTP